MPAANTFPLLNKQDILRGLQIGADSIGNVSSDDLENPTPIKVHAILKFFVINLLNEDPDEESFKQMEAKDMFEHQELHEDSTRSMAFFKAWCAPTPFARCGRLESAAVDGLGERAREASSQPEERALRARTPTRAVVRTPRLTRALPLSVA
tara:strand:+ start:100 stop:555 length:456 start_codon:yes stop_codon:yes gene_type:complete